MRPVKDNGSITATVQLAHMHRLVLLPIPHCWSATRYFASKNPLLTSDRQPPWLHAAVSSLGAIGQFLLNIFVRVCNQMPSSPVASPMDATSPDIIPSPVQSPYSNVCMRCNCILPKEEMAGVALFFCGKACVLA